MATRVLIAGGGVAALEAALALQALAEERVTTELLAPDPRFWYRPSATAEVFGLGDVRHFDLPTLAAAADATFTLGALHSVDQRRKVAHTPLGGSIGFDLLLVACGAVPHVAIPGALTFRGPADTPLVRQLLADVDAHRVRSIVFAVPRGAVWALPMYELALMTAEFVAAGGDRLRNVRLSVVTAEDAPLQLFGAAASEDVRALLDERGIALWTSTYGSELVDRELRVVPHDSMRVDAVVALPRLFGQKIDGLPQTVDGFVSVDPYGRVHGADDLFAAGDITTFPIKQGGIAAQQADAAAETIAASVGAAVTPQPFRPILRGLLLTGERSHYLRHRPAGGEGDTSVAADEPLWWPQVKIAGRYLAPFLADIADAGGVHSPAPEL